MDEVVGRTGGWESIESWDPDQIQVVSFKRGRERCEGRRWFGWLVGLYALWHCLKILLSWALLKVAWGSDVVDGWVVRHVVWEVWIWLLIEARWVAGGSLVGCGGWHMSLIHRTILKFLQLQVGGKCVGEVLTTKKVAGETMVLGFLQSSIWAY